MSKEWDSAALCSRKALYFLVFDSVFLVREIELCDNISFEQQLAEHLNAWGDSVWAVALSNCSYM